MKLHAIIRHSAVLLTSLFLMSCGLVPLPAANGNQVTEKCAESGAKPWYEWRAVRGGYLVGGEPAQGRRRLELLEPIAVAAYANDLFIADGAHRAVFRYDLVSDTLTRFASLAGRAGDVDLFVDAGFSLLIADGGKGVIERFDLQGTRLQTVRDDLNLPRPTAVVFDPARGEIVAADRLRGYLLRVSRLGAIVGSYGAGFDLGSRIGNIVALAQGPRELYAVDQAERIVHVFNTELMLHRVIGKGVLGIPQAVAVDDYQRVFVQDNADDTVKVFSKGLLSYPLSKPADGSFAQVFDLWSEGGFLYVADTLNSQVQILRLIPPCE